MFTKEKLYGSGTLVHIALHTYLNYYYYLNYTGIKMLRLCNDFNPSLSGVPFIALFSGAYNNMGFILLQ